MLFAAVAAIGIALVLLGLKNKDRMVLATGLGIFIVAVVLYGFTYPADGVTVTSVGP